MKPIILAITLICICAHIIWSVPSGPIPNALVSKSFQDFDPRRQFNLARISKSDLDQEVGSIKSTFKSPIPFVDAVLGWFGASPDAIPDNYLSSNIGSISGFCAANGSNDPTGPKNLMVYVDPGKNIVGIIDFAHPWRYTDDIQKRIAKIFGQDDMSFPSWYFGGNSNLKDPWGITTNGRGTFWVADCGNNRIIRYDYIAEEHRMIQSGVLDGFDMPRDVKYIDLGSNDGMLTIANTKGSNVWLLRNPYFGTHDNLFAIPGDQRSRLDKIGNDPLVEPRSLAVVNIDATIRIFVAHDKNRISQFKISSSTNEWSLINQINVTDITEISSIDADALGNLYCIDSKASRIAKFDDKLNLLYITGEPFSASTPPSDNQFKWPHFIYVDKLTKDIYISEKWADYNGLRRFRCAAKILDLSIANLHTNGYNPDVCRLQSARYPFPAVRCVLTDEAELTLSIETMDGAKIRDYYLGKQPAGHVEFSLDYSMWDGRRSGTPVADGSYILRLSAHKYAPAGQFDHNAVAVLKVDRTPPAMTNGSVRTNDYISPTNLLTLSLSIDNESAGGTFYVVSDNAAVSGSWQPLVINGIPLVFDVAPSSMALTLTQHLEIANQGLPAGQKFKIFAKFFDEAGNETEVIDLFAPPASVYAPLTYWPNAPQLTVSVSPLAFSPTPEIAGFQHHTTISAIIANNELSGQPVIPFWYYLAIKNAQGKIVRYLCDKTTGCYDFSNAHTAAWDGAIEPLDQKQFASDGIYTIEASAHDPQSGVTISAPPANVTVDTYVPPLSLSLPGNDFIQNGSSVLVFDKNEDGHLFLQHALSIGTTSDETIRLRMTRLASAGASPVEKLYTVALDAQTTQNIDLDLSELLDGIYTFQGWVEDRQGNSSASTPATSIAVAAAGNADRIIISRTSANFDVLVDKDAINPGESITHFLWFQSDALVEQGFGYTYELALRKPDGSLIAFADRPIGTSQKISTQWTAPATPAPSETGKYTFIARVRNDATGIESDPQEISFFIGKRPIEFGANLIAGASVCGSVYISGVVGDPDPSNSAVANGFDRYELYYTPGNRVPTQEEINTLGQPQNPWIVPGGGSTHQLFAPRYKQPVFAGSLFPYAGVAGVPTGQLGIDPIAYVNTSDLANGNYTVLVVSREKGTSSHDFATVGLTVDNAICAATAMAFTPGAIDIGSEQLTAHYAVSGIPANHSARVVATVVRVLPSGGTESYDARVIDIFEPSVASETPKAFQWNYADAFGNKVAGGTYRIFFAAEENNGTAVAWAQSNRLTLAPNLLLDMPDGLQTATTYNGKPAMVIPRREGDQFVGEDIVSLSFRVNKIVDAKLQVLLNGTWSDATNSERIENGALSPKTLSWDGSLPQGGLMTTSRAAPYQVRLAYKESDNPAAQWNFSGTYDLYVVSPAAFLDDAQSITDPSATVVLDNLDVYDDNSLDNATLGSSEIIYRTHMVNCNVRFAQSETVRFSLKASGTQQPPAWQTGPRNRYSIGVTKEIKQIAFRMSYTVSIDYNYDPPLSSGSVGCESKAKSYSASYSHDCTMAQNQDVAIDSDSKGITLNYGTVRGSNEIDCEPFDNYGFTTNAAITNVHFTASDGTPLDDFLELKPSTDGSFYSDWRSSQTFKKAYCGPSPIPFVPICIDATFGNRYAHWSCIIRAKGGWNSPAFVKSYAIAPGTTDCENNAYASLYPDHYRSIARSVSLASGCAETNFDPALIKATQAVRWIFALNDLPEQDALDAGYLVFAKGAQGIQYALPNTNYGGSTIIESERFLKEGITISVDRARLSLPLQPPRSIDAVTVSSGATVLAISPAAVSAGILTNPITFTLYCDMETPVADRTDVPWPFPPFDPSNLYNYPKGSRDPYGNASIPFKNVPGNPDLDPRANRIENLEGIYRFSAADFPSATTCDNMASARYLSYDLSSAEAEGIELPCCVTFSAIDGDVKEVPVSQLLSATAAAKLSGVQNVTYEVFGSTPGIEMASATTVRMHRGAGASSVPWYSTSDPWLPQGASGFTSGKAAFSHEGFQRISSEIDIKEGYGEYTGIKSFARSYPEGKFGSLEQLWSYPLHFWVEYNAASQTTFVKRNEALTYQVDPSLPLYQTIAGSSGVDFYYINGEPNSAVKLAQPVNTQNDRYHIEHATPYYPRRILEITGRMGGIPGFKSYSLSYYDVAQKQWHTASITDPLFKQSGKFLQFASGPFTQVFGYCDITQIAGDCVFKLTAADNLGRTKSAYQTIRIGKPIATSAAQEQIVYDPYSKAAMLFPIGNTFSGAVNIAPVNPTELAARVKSAFTPTGPVVSIEPGVAEFPQPQPVLSFNLSDADIRDILKLDPLTSLNEATLGSIHLYQVNQNELQPLEAARIKRFIDRYDASGTRIERIPVADGSNTLQPSDELVVEAMLPHASIFGCFDYSDRFVLDPPLSPVNQSAITLSGTARPGIAVNATISPTISFDKNVPPLATTIADANGYWRMNAVNLPNPGENFLFVWIDKSGNPLVRAATILVDGVAPLLVVDEQPVYVNPTRTGAIAFDAGVSEKGNVFIAFVGQGDQRFMGIPLREQPTNGQPYGVTISVPVDNSAQGRSSIAIKAEDEAGNTSELAFKSIIFDSDPPAINEFAVQRADSWWGNIVSFSLHARAMDEEAIQMATLRVVNRSTGQPIYQQNYFSGEKSYLSIDDQIALWWLGYSSGLLDIELTVVDKAGNATTMHRDFDSEDYANWPYSKTITLYPFEAGFDLSQDIDSIPVLVRFDGSTINFQQAKPDGADLRFASSQSEHLAFDIEQWDTASHLGAIWVLLPKIERFATSVSFTVCWGKWDAQPVDYGTQVWQRRFASVYHGNAQVIDSVSPERKLSFSNAARDGAAMGSGVQVSDGYVASGLSFDGTNDYLEAPAIDTSIHIGNVFTLSAWLLPAAGRAQTIAGIDSGANPWQLFIDNSGCLNLKTGAQMRCLIPNFPVNTWANLALSYNGNTLIAYLDGTPRQQSTMVFDFGLDEKKLFFGKGSFDNSYNDFIRDISIAHDSGTIVFTATAKIPALPCLILGSPHTWAFWFEPSGSLSLEVNQQRTCLLNSLLTPTWQQIKITYDGTRLKVYRNGWKKLELCIHIPIDWSQLDTLIAQCLRRSSFSGTMDEIRIATSALPADWIRMAYQIEKRGQQVVETRPETPFAPLAVPAIDGSFGIVLQLPAVQGAIDSIEISRATEGDSSWTTIAAVAGGGRSFTDTTIACGTSYAYRIRYQRGMEQSDWSPSVAALSPRCYENWDLLTLDAMLYDAQGKPLTSDSLRATVRFFSSPYSTNALYEESILTSARNGFSKIVVGRATDLWPILDVNRHLYVEFSTTDGLQGSRRPLAAFGVTDLAIAMHRLGNGIPADATNAAIGTLFYDSASSKLYFKYGVAADAWQAVQ
jgi:hypothetical protein